MKSLKQLFFIFLFFVTTNLVFGFDGPEPPPPEPPLPSGPEPPPSDLSINNALGITLLMSFSLFYLRKKTNNYIVFH